MRDHAALFICGTVVMFIIVFLTQWLQYNKTYTVAYKESANRRIVLAENCGNFRCPSLASAIFLT